VLQWIVTVDGTDEAFLPAGTTSYSVTGLGIGRHTISVRGINGLGGAAFAAQVVVIPDTTPAPPLPVKTATLTAAPSLVVAGSAATLRGLFATDAVPTADAVVTLWAQSGTGWVSVATTLTAADGTYAFSVVPTRSTRYRAITTGMPSAYSVVTVRPKVTTNLGTRLVRKVPHVTLAVTVSPRLGGTLVRLQRLSGTTWVTVNRAKLSRASTVTFDLGRPSIRSSRFRILVAATATTASATTGRILAKAPGR
jgi:hypothetical protein